MTKFSLSMTKLFLSMTRLFLWMLKLFSVHDKSLFCPLVMTELFSAHDRTLFWPWQNSFLSTAKTPFCHWLFSVHDETLSMNSFFYPWENSTIHEKSFFFLSMSIKNIFEWELYGQMELEFGFKDGGRGIGRSDQILFCLRFRVGK